ncbi:MFS transporter [Micrococcus luteus]
MSGQTVQSTRRTRLRAVSGSFVGTTIEWYDFYLYGLAAALVFNVQFFPGSTPLGGSIASFATLAVGVVVRPLGGILAGHFGDRVGRKSLLVVSLVLMGAASVGIGLLPTFEQVGWWSVVGLVLLRCLQGLSAGMEWGGAALMSVEHAPAGRRGFFGSFTQVGSSAGMLLATGAFTVTTALSTPEQFAAFGWRIPFLASAVLVAVGLLIRLGVQDAEEFRQLREADGVSSAPVLELLRHHTRPVLVTAGLRLGQNGLYYLVTTYLVSYLVLKGLDSSVLLEATMIASAIGLISTPFWGALSDRYGRRRVSQLGYCLTAVAGWVLFFVAEAGALSVLPLVVVLVINVAHDSVYGPQAAWFAEQFPVRVRYSGVNLGYQLGTVVGGGFAPFIAALLFQAGNGTPWLIAGYLTLLAVLSLAASALARDPRGADDVDLVGAGDPRVPEARPAPAAPSAEDHPTDHLVTQEAR